MKNFLVLSMLCLVSSLTISAQKEAFYKQSDDHLRVNAELMKTVYCNNNGLALILKVVYTNTSKSNIILSKNYPLTASHVIRKIDSEKLENPVVITSNSLITYGNYQGSENFPDPNYFVIIKPEETYEVESVMFTTYSYNPKHGIGLKEGKYNLKLTLSTFPFLYDNKKFS